MTEKRNGTLTLAKETNTGTSEIQFGLNETGTCERAPHGVYQAILFLLGSSHLSFTENGGANGRKCAGETRLFRDRKTTTKERPVGEQAGPAMLATGQT